MIKNGYIKPKKQKTEDITVMFNGFKYDYKFNKRVDIKYFIVLKFKDPQDFFDKYIIAYFQDPVKPEKFIKKVIPIVKGSYIVYVESDNMYGFKNMRSYLTKIQIADTNTGERIFDSIDQYSRVEYIPDGYKNEI